ncbi:PLAC8-domain-containing protein [Xylariaceae sp. AK1471]|nr:PLAC8-domain-containing protein [Xylariaceae sp. AK1471]
MATGTQNANNGPIDANDLNDWKDRFNQVLAQPSEHLNSKSPDSAQSWTSNFIEFWNPVDTCLITWCLPCVTFGKTHHRLRKNGNLEGYEPINTSCLLLCGSSCFGLHWLVMALQRANVREKYHLQGNCLVDIAASCCCGCCSLVQQDKEAAYWESKRADDAGYTTNEEMRMPK